MPEPAGQEESGLTVVRPEGRGPSPGPADREGAQSSLASPPNPDPQDQPWDWVLILRQHNDAQEVYYGIGKPGSPGV